MCLAMSSLGQSDQLGREWGDDGVLTRSYARIDVHLLCAFVPDATVLADEPRLAVHVHGREGVDADRAHCGCHRVRGGGREDG